MTISAEADALATTLLASYPGWPVSEMSILALAETLDRIGLDIAPAVMDRARRTMEKPPSVASLYDLAREVRDERERAVQVTVYDQLPAVMEAFPPGMADRIREMTDPDRKREQDEQRIAAETAEWERKREAMKALPLLRGACPGAGKPAVMVNGVLSCPACREPIAEGCRPSNVGGAPA